MSKVNSAQRLVPVSGRHGHRLSGMRGNVWGKQRPFTQLDAYCCSNCDGCLHIPPSRSRLHIQCADTANMGPIDPSLWLPAPLAAGITPRSAHLLALLFTSAYVGSLYLVQNIFLARPTSGQKVPLSETTTAITSPAPISAGNVDPNHPEVGSRDHPDTIRIRMKAVMGATAASLAGVLWTVKSAGLYDWLGAVSYSAFSCQRCLG